MGTSDASSHLKIPIISWPLEYTPEIPEDRCDNEWRIFKNYFNKPLKNAITSVNKIKPKTWEEVEDIFLLLHYYYHHLKSPDFNEKLESRITKQGYKVHKHEDQKQSADAALNYQMLDLLYKGFKPVIIRCWIYYTRNLNQ
jgi:hypothetical protein